VDAAESLGMNGGLLPSGSDHSDTDPQVCSLLSFLLPADNTQLAGNLARDAQAPIDV